MEDIEEIQDTPVRTGNKAKGNPNRTPAQIEAFERAKAKRQENARIKREHDEAVKKQRDIELEAKKRHTQEIQQKLSQYQTDDDDCSNDEEVIVKPKAKTKPKPKAKKIIYQEESESEEEEVIIVRKPKKKPVPKKKIVYQQEESDEEEEAPAPKKSLPNQIQRTSREQLQHDLQTERIQSALRSLGYIA